MPTKLPENGNPLVFLDITLGGEPLGRILIELFADTVPKTAANFLAFCVGSQKSSTGQPQGYKGSKFHRVIPNFMVQGGDFIHGDGSGVCSIYGGQGVTFPDENFSLKHESKGLLSMANAGKDGNGCQFFITLAPANFLDGKHVVFGKVVGEEGLKVLDMMGAVRTGRRGRDVPDLDVVVSQCGEM